ncbi:recombination mediator RecR [bacterium]|nr:recombination mediator RecR [bacterium]
MNLLNPIDRLVHELSKLPGIGERTATRLAFYILRSDSAYAKSMARALIDVKEKIRLCNLCFNVTDKDTCDLCLDPRRDRSIICVVEEPSDMVALEKTNNYRGLYHVLHGSLSPLDGIGPSDIKVVELITRLHSGEVREVIVATNPNVEGEATALYISKLVRPSGIKLTRIASGIPVGGDIEYVDLSTLSRALEERRDIV